jgi:hypothetical protein
MAVSAEAYILSSMPVSSSRCLATWTLAADVEIVGSGIRHAPDPVRRSADSSAARPGDSVGSKPAERRQRGPAKRNAAMDATEYAREVIRELDRTLAAVSPQEAERLADLVLNARRIFIAGAGRSGLAVRAFAMRLMQMGLAAYVVGETVTPA